MAEQQETLSKASAASSFMKVAPAALILLYMTLALVKIGNPGLQYDEVLWGNAALGGIDSSFITYKVGDLPVLLMPYIGAIKSYIYYPIFQIFGTSVFSIRIPAILMTAAGLYLLFGALQKMLNRKMALIVLFLLCIDPSFISQTRVDCGPIVIEFCCKVLALYFLGMLLNQMKYPALFGLYVVLAVGIFNKLNFIWFVNSFFLALFVVYWRTIKEAVAARGAWFLVWNAVGCLVLYGYYLFISATYSYTKPFISPFSEGRFTQIFLVFRDLVTGVSFYDYALGNLHSTINTLYFFLAMLVLFAGALVATLSRNRGDRVGILRLYLFFWIILLSTLLQILVTEQASANWHLFAVYPSFTILQCLSILVIADYLGLEGSRLHFAAIALLLGVTVYSAGVNFRYIQAYDQPIKNVSWSNANQQLIEYTRNSTYKFVSVDWGTHSQLITCDPVPSKYREICYGLDAETQEEVAQKVNELFDPANRYAFIMHPVALTTFMNPREGLFYEAQRRGVSLKLLRTISDGEKVIYEIYLPDPARS